jgi:hypothetical protein
MKRIFAISAESPASEANPKNPAMSAKIKKMSA